MAFSVKDFLARLNWRQVVIHALAFWFFMHAFETLYYLFNLEIISTFKASGNSTKKLLEEQEVTVEDLSLFLIWQTLSGAIGWLTALFLSIILSVKQRWFWLNVIFSLFLLLLLLRVPVWSYTKHLFYYPGRLFSNSITEFLINGGLLLTLGLLLFFLKPINRFIERGAFHLTTSSDEL
ncbi:hypothetical protein ESA94_10825 [Lacibacter luteus]|uniref:Uncharacterized protein n=1 Tax=Lacibacter luteus TaxID=2508719 RepID=A0A4Q1CJT2_9BACT|nr:hypothetical protein [Lacibacter luteus]RXK60941.1 hypothetical protein ESA94_10825 [Lacibacter luteus]